MSTSDDRFVATGPSAYGFSTKQQAPIDYGVIGRGKVNGVVGYSDSTDSPAILGRLGAAGPSNSMGSTTPNPAGVYATSHDYPGLFGTSKASAGVVGFSTDYAGVVGVSSNFLAGSFLGDVGVSGTLTAGVKNAAVRFPDGSQRLLHCMESPEHWFEDFGSARLVRGRVVVKLDADFAKVVQRDDYRVFLTPEGDCRGLYIRNKNRRGFEVRELQGGKSSIAFCYRIVARRKDIEGHKRFAKVDPRIPTQAAMRAARGRMAGSPSSLHGLFTAVARRARTRARKSAE